MEYKSRTGRFTWPASDGSCSMPPSWPACLCITEANGSAVQRQRTPQDDASSDLRVFGEFVVADVGIAVDRVMTPLSGVVPIEPARLFGQSNLVRSIAERQVAGKPATADGFC